MAASSRADLQEQRRTLPYTWHWRAHDPDVSEKTWRRLFSLSSEAEMLRHLDWCEETYGVGHYKARRELLDATLDVLVRENVVDLATVVDVLAAAKVERDTASAVGIGIDDARHFADDREGIRRNARDALRRLAAFMQERTAPNFRPLPVEQSLQSIQSILAFVETSPLFVEPVKTPTRRPRPGHQPEPWIADAKRKLGRAKVPRALHTDLLIAVGLLPYKWSGGVRRVEVAPSR